MSFILLGILNSQAEAVAAGSYDLLESTVLTSSASSVSFTGLDSYSNYKHLQIRTVARSTTNTQNAGMNMRLRFNSDTGNNYARHALGSDGGTVFSSAGTSIDFMNIDRAVGSGSETNAFGASVIDILDFSSTAKNTTMRAMGAGSISGALSSAGDYRLGLNSNLYNNTAAITSVFMEPGGGSFLTGSRFSLYGIKAA